MKKTWVFTVLSVLLVLSFAVTQVLASPAEADAYARTPDRTPGARPTENADRQATRRAENANERGNGNPGGGRVNLRGIIVAADAASLTISLEDGSSATVALTAETRIRVPTLSNAATAADLRPGLRVNVQAVAGEDGSLTARAVQVVPGQPVQAHNVGIVVDYQPGERITIKGQDGNLYTYLLTDETRLLPEERLDLLQVGARVTIIAPRDVTTTDLVARGIVIHPASTEP